MIAESPNELEFVTQTANQIVYGEPREGSLLVYSKPDALAMAHGSMTRQWKALEWLPKRSKHKEWAGRTGLLGWYVPRSEPRFVGADAVVHESVRERMEKCESFRPVNLGSKG